MKVSTSVILSIPLYSLFNLLIVFSPTKAMLTGESIFETSLRTEVAMFSMIFVSMGNLVLFI